jgi:flagellar motor switch protein FliN/FliY
MLDVVVEIGRTKMSAERIKELGKGSVVELDKKSSEPVSLFADGKLIAKGNVVVIEENFGVVITEISE